MWSLNPFAPPDFTGNNTRLAGEIQWTDNYTPQPGTPDQFVLDYARDKYKELAESYSTLDGKADRLLRVSGVFAGILTAGLLGLKIQPLLLLSAAPTFVFMLAAMLLCIIAQVPYYKSSPPTVHNLLDGLEQGVQDRVELWVAIGFHKAREKLRVTCDWKANRIIWATWSFTIGVFFLILIPLGYLFFVSECPVFQTVPSEVSAAFREFHQ